MLRLSKKLLFAIEAVVDIAYYSESEPVRSTDICKRQGIPRRYLEQVLQQLVHHDILTGQRGPRGGYRLARDGERIRLGDIIRIVRELEGTPDPIADPVGSELGQRIVRPIWREMQNEMMSRFDAITVADLCRRASSDGLDERQAAEAG
ncbi:transcriptional regulator, BadM/Rrf2 family [Tistlia consotensis]|uniref:Transcriptional regulator, BadM/Rrf2 family n=1 Tax=Tistlia consotensis USBA 355 TaxID=560819 RepID=A0A1Y6BCP5_9PROT|nr:Rrf2 family transcriptional regulator [Tistlia consotensis]SME94024.1 transcriptional regulator, BadM/Rrf2 family [Tistlia consotensis USBA 355]SNR28993.1 transcriptional regulator, BadM/Rrf2 family [Tistlia consotensis]